MTRFIDHVSEVAKAVRKDADNGVRYLGSFDQFILPDPEPDVLAEAIHAAGYATLDGIEPEFAEHLRNELAKRGGRIVFDGVQS